MKRIVSLISIAAFTAVALVSCNKEVERENVEEQGQAYSYTFAVANGDAENADAETKSVLGSDANGMFLQWENTDKLNTWALYTGGSGAYSYNNQSSINASTNPVTFTIVSYRALAVDDPIYAMYPYTGTSDKTPTTDMTIPATQTQTGTSFDASAMPMVAEPFGISAAVSAQGSNDETSKVHFYNLGSIVEFDIYSPTGTYSAESINSVTFTSTSNIAGTFSFDLTTVDASDLATSLSLAGKSYSVKSVKTNVTSLSVGEATSVANAKKVYMVLAPGSYTGTIVLKTNIASYEYTISSAKDFQRAKVKRLGLNLESGTCTRNLIGYEIPVSIDFKERTNVEYVEFTGADYYAANASYFFGSTLRFDASNEQIIIPTKAAFGDISIVALYNTSSTPSSTLKVFGSADGSSYTLIDTPSFTHGTNVIAAPDAVVVTNTESSYRLIKMVFTKNTGNLAVGSISIAALDTTPRITASDITAVAATGVVDAPAMYNAHNFVDDVTVTSVTGCVSEAIAMDGDIVYTVTPNYTGAERNGTIVLASTADPSVTKTIAVTQNADVFSVSTTSVLVGKGAGSTETFTVTSTYAFTVESSDTGVLTVSPASGSGSDSPQTITVTAVTANDAAEKLLGTVTITRTVDDYDELEVTVNQQAGGGGSKTNQMLFHETFGNNSGSARAWDDSYSVKSGVSAVYSGITSYTVSNAKQGKNTTGSTQSGLNQSTQGTDAYIIIGPLSVADAENMVLTYDWKAASVKGTYTTKLYYKTSSGGSFTEVSGTGTGATSFVTRTYNLPVAAQVSTLYLKIVWNTSNTQAIIDEVNLQGDY